MPIRNSVATGALIAATLATAAGLNLAVMGLNRTDTTDPTGEGAEAAAPADSADIELTSATAAPTAGPVPVLAVGLAATAGAADPPAEVIVAPGRTGSPVSTAETSASPPPTSAPTTATGPTSTPTSTATSITPTSTTPTSNMPTTTISVSTEYLTYEFEGVASIVVALHGGQHLEFWSVSPEEGWAYRVDDRGPRQVEITFRPVGGGDEAVFELDFDDGRLEAKREY